MIRVSSSPALWTKSVTFTNFAMSKHVLMTKLELIRIHTETSLLTSCLVLLLLLLLLLLLIRSSSSSSTAAVQRQHRIAFTRCIVRRHRVMLTRRCSSFPPAACRWCGHVSWCWCCHHPVRVTSRTAAAVAAAAASGVIRRRGIDVIAAREAAGPRYWQSIRRLSFLDLSFLDNRENDIDDVAENLQEESDAEVWRLPKSTICIRNCHRSRKVGPSVMWVWT